MLGYSIERESVKRFLVGFYLAIALGMCVGGYLGNMASCLYQPSDFIWVGCSSGTIGLLPFELERYWRHRQLPELRKRLIFLIINFTINLAINIESIVGHGNIDWISHLAGFITGILLIIMMSDYTGFPEYISDRKQLFRRIAGFLFIVMFGLLVLGVFARQRVKGIGYDLYKSGAPCL